MDEATTASAVASVAAEAVRTLNHLTLDPSGSPDLPALYAVVGQLQLLAERLPQTLEQLAGVLERPGVGYGSDDGRDPAAVVADAVVALRAGAGDAHELAES